MAGASSLRRAISLSETSPKPLGSGIVSSRAAFALVVFATLCYALHTTLSRATYDYGPGPLTILLFRSLVSVIVLYILLRFRGLNPWPRARLIWLGLVLGVGMAGMAMAMLTALYFIPTSLLILVFYLFPAMVAVISHLSGLQKITTANAAVLAAAFVGVTIALGVSPQGLDWRGVALGLLAALLVAVNVVGSAAFLRSANSTVLTFIMAVAMCTVFVVANALRGEVVLPRDPAGWWPLMGSVFAYIVASVALYAAIQSIGPPRVSIIMNVEPIFTITLAGVILGERLTEIQLLGAAIVVGAISANAYLTMRRARTVPAPVERA